MTTTNTEPTATEADICQAMEHLEGALSNAERGAAAHTRANLQAAAAAIANAIENLPDSREG